MVLKKIKEMIKEPTPKLVIPYQFFHKTQRILELFQKPKTKVITKSKNQHWFKPFIISNQIMGNDETK
jgi:hypothetical protein